MSKKKGDAPESEEVKTAEAETSENKDENVSEEKPQVPTSEELLAAEKDKYMWLYAEYENYRKRSSKEREALYSQVKSDTVIGFLPVYDNLERALKTGCSDEAFLKGIEMTMTQLRGVFEKLGIKEIDAVGKKFDANLHNAVMHVEDESLGESEIVEEFQKGFTLGDKVIRFSMVKVAN